MVSIIGQFVQEKLTGEGPIEQVTILTNCLTTNRVRVYEPRRTLLTAHHLFPNYPQLINGHYSPFGDGQGAF